MLKLCFQVISKSQFRRSITLSALAPVLLLSALAHSQDTENKRARKYTPPPPTAHVSVAVVKDTTGKPIENAAVIFHMTGEEGKGNMEMKTNGEGKAIIDVVPIGDVMTLQVIADGFQTYGEDYKIDTDSKEITVRLKRPARQYSVYEHAAAQNSSGQSSGQTTQPKPTDTQTPPKQ